MYNDSPVIAICGHGECGKDEVAKWFSKNTSLLYKHSTSYAAAIVMFKQIKEGWWGADWIARRENTIIKLYQHKMSAYNYFSPSRYDTIEDFYNDRRNHRQFWSDWIDCYNLESDSLTKLYELACMQGNRILTGIRKLRELEGCLKTGLIDLTIWIERAGLMDQTQEYGKEICDMAIDNNEDIPSLHKKLGRLIRSMQLIIDI